MLLPRILSGIGLQPPIMEETSLSNIVSSPRSTLRNAIAKFPAFVIFTTRVWMLEILQYPILGLSAWNMELLFSTRGPNPCGSFLDDKRLN